MAKKNLKLNMDKYVNFFFNNIGELYPNYVNQLATSNEIHIISGGSKIFF